jgi:hypothetical protein
MPWPGLKSGIYTTKVTGVTEPAISIINIRNNIFIPALMR